ncbi:dynein light chain LC6, flagellar outer arm [Actinia tenebrosa]|uniref:Dynein light chain n=1 Tax=Actinia tenebrosa TaxID=6105 RepID=A0A6P8H226_ACTTE|nr:dynein light chain LC6, flagellar outer arm [Actinia tenebrosa]
MEEVQGEAELLTLYFGVVARKYKRFVSLIGPNYDIMEGIVQLMDSNCTVSSVAKYCSNCGDLFLDKMTERKAVIKNADMSEDMQQDAIECATQAIEKFNIEKDIAAFVKKEFDKKYNPTWHCIVGRNFGSYVTHETKHFIYFYLGQVAILLFKSG